MSKIKLTGNSSGTGVLTVTAPNTSTDRTITLPDGTGTLIADDGSGNVTVSGALTPASMNWSTASSRQDVSQSIPNSTSTVVSYETVVNDELGELSTAGRFTAQVAGTYFVYGGFAFGSEAWGAELYIIMDITKNGASIRRSLEMTQAAGTFPMHKHLSAQVVLAVNDYVEITVYQSNGSAISINGDTTDSHFSITRVA